MKKILLAPELKQQIAEELKLSDQSVRMSLDYVFKKGNSEQVRKRAKELLQQEADNVIISINK